MLAHATGALDVIPGLLLDDLRTLVLHAQAPQPARDLVLLVILVVMIQAVLNWILTERANKNL